MHKKPEAQSYKYKHTVSRQKVHPYTFVNKCIEIMATLLNI